MALQDVYLKKKICGNNLVDIVTTLANEALMHILLEDPPADLTWEMVGSKKCISLLSLSVALLFYVCF